MRGSPKHGKGKGKRRPRIGIFGGSFDPPHIGHLVIAKAAMRQLRLDRVLFVPASVPPHKRGGTSASPRERLAMVRLALKGNSHFAVSDLEIKRKGISFTAVTLKALQRRFPNAEFCLLVGSDNAKHFHTWKSPDEIARYASIAIYKRKRGGVLRKKYRAKVFRLKGPVLDISSSGIRKMIAEHRPVRRLLPPTVLRFIVSKHLYKRI